MIVVADASVLIALAACGKLDLLRQLWKVVFIPPAVRNEVVQEGKVGAEEIERAISEGWIIVQSVASEEKPGSTLGKGESECFALAGQMRADLILLDDNYARRKAERLGFRRVGTIGIFLAGIGKGLIAREELPLLLDRLSSIDFRLSPKLKQMLFNVLLQT